MTTETLFSAHAVAVDRPSPMRILKTTLLMLALIVGIGALTLTAVAKAVTDEDGRMAGYA